MSAGALCIPAGTHFLLEGSASSLPSRFHIPSSSRGVRWSLTAFLSDCCSEVSSSLPPPSSSTCSVAGSEPDGFFRPGRRNWLPFYVGKWFPMYVPSMFACVHTNAQRVFLKLRCEVGSLGQAEDVALQHVPAHLVVEGVTKLHWNLWWRWKRHLTITKLITSCHLQLIGVCVCTYPRSVFYITDVKLHRDVEAVQEVSSKHHRVHRGVDSMNPTWV